MITDETLAGILAHSSKKLPAEMAKNELVIHCQKQHTVILECIQEIRRLARQVKVLRERSKQ